jgi:hypothetical protein
MSRISVHIFCGICGAEMPATSDLEAPSICSSCVHQDLPTAQEEIIPLVEEEEEEDFDEDEGFVGRDVKTLTLEQLWKAMDEVDDDRKMFVRRLRGCTWTAEDREMFEKMNDWAGRVYKEILSR